MKIEKFNSEDKFSSLYIVEQINEFRKIEGNKATLAHFTLLKKIEGEFSEEITDKKIIVSHYNDASGKKNKCYDLTFEESLQLLMSESKTVRKGVVEKLKELSKPKIPQTYAQALMLAAKQAEQIELQEKEIKELTPKAEFYDAVTGSPDTVDMAEVAKILNMGIGRNTIFDILRRRSILNRKNIPYQTFVDRGYFRLIETEWQDDKGNTHINIKTVVFQKGVEFIKKMISKN